jgi:hypothetical protein
MAATGVVTEAYRAYLAKLSEGSLPADPIETVAFSFYRFGEGGYVIDPGSGRRVVAPPDPTLIDIIATGTDPITDPGNGLFRYERAFSGADVQNTGAGVIVLQCSIAPSAVEVDDKGILDPTTPRLYELGIFRGTSGGDETMIMHITFDERLKIVGKGLVVTVPFTF